MDRVVVVVLLTEAIGRDSAIDADCGFSRGLQQSRQLADGSADRQTRRQAGRQVDDNNNSNNSSHDKHDNDNSSTSGSNTCV